ncbi:MAG: hypothetical protein ACYCYI_01840 [Saccharofermentanales bacterium]
MELFYKPDWEKTKQRYISWWAHEDQDRCLISVVAPKTDPHLGQPPALPEKTEDIWFDHDYIHAANEHRFKSTYYGGEALPVWHPGYPGWSSITCYMGADIELSRDTGWINPIIENGSLTDYDYRDFTIKPDNKWWLRTEEMYRFALEDSKGRSIPGLLPNHGCGDSLSFLRGTEQLLIDVIECPDYVREFDKYLMEQWMQVYEKYFKMTCEKAEGSTSFLVLWSPGRYCIACNDFSYMISPKMFQDIFLQNIEIQCNFLDHTIYHVDGIGAFAHVEALCAIPKLQALQILPGAGKPSPLYYMDTLKKVQKAGKNLHITINPDEVGDALDNLSSTGLFIDTWCSSENDALDLIKKAEKSSRVRK